MNFLSSIFKTPEKKPLALNGAGKKTLIFALLFLTLAGLIVPRITTAASTGAWVTCGAAVAGAFATIWTGPGVVGAPAIITLGCAELAVTSGPANDILKGMLLAVAEGLYYITLALANYSTTWFSEIMSLKFMTAPILQQTALATGWGKVRDLSNMFIVLGFVVIGIATALRLKEYEAKKLLPKLIIIALLINFSGLLVGVVIDASNIITTYFLQGSSWIGHAIVTMIESSANKVDWNVTAENGAGGLIMTRMSFVLTYIFIAITFFYLVFILMARQAIFGIFFVLSPLAFVCWIFPQTKKIWTMWWENFIKWAFIGAQVVFFVWVASQMANSKMTTIEVLTICILLFVAITVAKKSSAIGASSVIGLATAAAGLAMGAAAGGAKLGGKGLMAGADKMTGGAASRATQAISGATGRTMERLGLRKEGITTMKEGAAIAEEQKRYEAMFNSGNSGDKAKAIQAAKTGRGVHKAAANAAAVRTENINDVYRDSAGNVDAAAMHRGLQFTEQFGAGENVRKNAEKQNWQLAGQNERNVEKERAAMSLPNTAAGRARAKSSVDRKQIEKQWGNMDTEAKSRIDLSSFHPDDASTLVMGKNGTELLESFRSLPAGNTTRNHNRDFVNGVGGVGGIVGANLNATQPNLDVGTGKAIDDELDVAYDAGDVNRQRELVRRRNAAKALL